MLTPRQSVAACSVLLAPCSIPVTARQASSAKSSPLSCQQPQAAVLPNGDLRWTPQHVVFKGGALVRYIDYAGGIDNV